WREEQERRWHRQEAESFWRRRRVGMSTDAPAESLAGRGKAPTALPLGAAPGLQFSEPCIFELGTPGRHGASVGKLDVPEVSTQRHFGATARAVPAGLPEVSEPEAVRHFVRLSQWNFCTDSQFYPLGSCTMKYNPK